MNLGKGLMRCLIVLIILSFISVASCKRPEPVLVPIGEVRVVGIIKKGIVTYADSENAQGDYSIVTPAFVIKFIELAYEVKRLQLELKKCQEEKGAK